MGQATEESVGGQHRGVYGELQGAAALCGGGESEQVSDRPRAQDWDPESSYGGVGGRYAVGCGVQLLDLHDRSCPRGWSDAAVDGARWR